MRKEMEKVRKNTREGEGERGERKRREGEREKRKTGGYEKT